MGRDRKQVGLVILVIFGIIVGINAFTMFVYAKDYGVVGHSYEISEQDIVEYIKTKLQDVDLESVNKQMQDQVHSTVNRPKAVEGLIKAEKSREYYYDPTYILDRDIYDHKGTLIHAVGTKINPLSKIPLSNALIFIDGDDDEQVKYALSEFRGLDRRAKIILTNGSPIALQKKHKIWIYFDQFGYLTKKFSIKHLPAKVTQSGLSLKIQEVALQ